MSIPDEILAAFPDSGTEPGRRVLETVVLDLYREGRISAGRVAELLGISRLESDQLLREHHLLESPSSERCEADRSALEKSLGS